MLPNHAGNTPLSQSSKEKLDYYFQRFCEGENGRRYGVAHIVYACHASFPLLLSPALANLIWLNFKNFTLQKTASILPETKDIDAVVVSDFLLSSLVRPVAAKQYETIPEIRTYLLYLLMDGRWFALQGITGFGSPRLKELAQFVWQYTNDKSVQKENSAKGFIKVNEWAALAYLQPDKLAIDMAMALQENFKTNNELGQLHLNLLMDRFDDQFELQIKEKDQPKNAFINLHTYSKANKAKLFERSIDTISDLLAEITPEFIGQKNSNTTLLEFPVEKLAGQRMQRKKNGVQRVLSLLIGIDKYADPSINQLAGYTQSVDQIGDFLRTLNLKSFETEIIKILTNEVATREGIIDAIREIYSRCNAEDICLIYLASHGANSNYTENTVIPFDYRRENSQNGISNSDFLEIVTRSNFNKCQSVFLLSSNTGYYKWVNENDIFIGAVRHTLKRMIQSPSFSGSSFGKSFQEIINQTEGKIIYRDMYLWLNFKMENDFEHSEENPVMLTSRENLDNYFLTKNPVGPHNYSLIAFNKQIPVWQPVDEDFKTPLLNTEYTIHAYGSNDFPETVYGQLYHNGTHLIFDPYSNLLLPEKLYKIYSYQNLLTTYIHYSREQYRGIAAKIAERLGNFQPGHFSMWNGIKAFVGDLYNVAEQKNTRHGRGELAIHVADIGNNYHFHAAYFSSDRQNFIDNIAWNVPDEKTLINSINKFAGYCFFKNLLLEDYLGIAHLQAGIQYQWSTGKERIPLSETNMPVYIDNNSFTVQEDKIRFNPLDIFIINHEEYPLFYDVYLVASDFTIKKISPDSNKIVENKSPAIITMNEPVLLDKIFSNNLTAQVKVLLSRDPIRYDFSQTGID